MISRRHLLRWGAVAIGLPLLPSLMRGAAKADTGPLKRRFIGCFFPSGAAMPGGDSGDWTLDGALSPVAAAGLQNNISIVRGFRTVEEVDVHWSGTAAFMSCNHIGTWTMPASDPRAGQRCGKTFDQYIAALQQTKLGSLHAGYGYVPGWDEGHDDVVSIQYVNSIAWKDEHSPISNTRDPQTMFTQVFGDGSNVADPHIAYLLDRRQSVLDGVLGDLASLRTKLSTEDQMRMDAYATGIRDLEGQIATSRLANTCVGDGAVDNDPEQYLASMRTMQHIIVRAFECDAVRAATLMYHEGIGDSSITSTTPDKQHFCAHNDWDELKSINRIQVGLWAELIAELKTNSLLQDTVVLLGSNMSDGRAHIPTNIPLVLASDGPGLKLGTEVIGTTALADRTQNRNLADLYVDLFSLYGASMTTFGEDAWANTGVPSGILSG